MVSSLNILSPITNLPFIASVYKNRLKKLGIFTLRDLVYYFPFRYDDLSNKKPISQLEIGETATVQATLWQITKLRSGSGKILIKATFTDGEATIEVIWFNQLYLLTTLKPNQVINLSGKVGIFGKKVTLINPKYEIIKASVPIHTERLVPVYPQIAGISSKWLRTRIYQVLFSSEFQINEFLPEKLLKQENLPEISTALKSIHFPVNLDAASKARRRFAFEELLLLHLRNCELKKLKQKNSQGLPFAVKNSELIKFEKSLPFELTFSQKTAVKEITNDLEKSEPMNRLLQGEVGSGKTVVSCFAILAAMLNKYQVAFMAPTEILANQHFQTLSTLLKNFKVELATSASKLKNEDFDLVVGTHALLNKNLKFKKLGLIIVDEQQRFGVVQRTLLREKGNLPHFLTMTATPIPRTLALTIYGDLAISILDELPSGRKKIRTYLVPRNKRGDAYNFIKKEVASGGQAYIICPLIEASETLLSVKSAKEEFNYLQTEVFINEKLELLHGKLTSKEKSQVIEKFRERQVDILVSTPVIEVGIDIPNASIIVIEASERFGLSSLHQLRGRVGRGERESFCLLFTQNQSPRVEKRLKLLEKYNNGLELAEMDLRLRGSGDVYGTLQSGQLDLRVADSANLNLIIETKKVAQELSSHDLEGELKKQILALTESQAGIIKD